MMGEAFVGYLSEISLCCGKTIDGRHVPGI
jgi:hypothetical protein